MGKALFQGTIYGAIILFIWMMISWMLIPWHCASLHKFSNERQVASVIMDNISEEGIYVLPNFCDRKDEIAKAQSEEMMKSGPRIFAAVRHQGFGEMGAAPYIISFILQLIGALGVTIIAINFKPLTYFSRVGLITLIGFIVAILGIFPAWNWWGFSFSYVFIALLDLVIGWFLAGLAIAKVTEPARLV